MENLYGVLRWHINNACMLRMRSQGTMWIKSNHFAKTGQQNQMLISPVWYKKVHVLGCLNLSRQAKIVEMHFKFEVRHQLAVLPGHDDAGSTQTNRKLHYFPKRIWPCCWTSPMSLHHHLSDLHSWAAELHHFIHSAACFINSEISISKHSSLLTLLHNPNL